MSNQPAGILSTLDHRRDSAGLTYVYPVLSRRAAGLSVGINLNPNNACNWRCIYCQVPNLMRGAAPAIDVARLEAELRAFLSEVVQGDFLVRRLPEGGRRLNDLAISGNGEPTSAREFEAVIDTIGRIRAGLELSPSVSTILITNGSFIQRRSVQDAVRKLAVLSGEVWFKIDRATDAGIRVINDVPMSMRTVRRNLETAARVCPTWIQTCVFALDGEAPSVTEINAYVGFLAELRADHVPLRGVLLYGIARPSLQPEAARLSRLPDDWIEALGARVRALGYEVRVTP